MTRIQAPRGTHDVLPTEQPLWQTVTGEMEQLCALYGYRRIQTPGLRGHRAVPRTAGAGSDVVQKEMYTLRGPGDRRSRFARKARRRSAGPTSSTGCTASRSP